MNALNPSHHPDPRLLALVEAIVFAADEPVTAARLAAVYAEVHDQPAPTLDLVHAAVEHINQRFELEGHVLCLEAWAGGVRMSTSPTVAPYLKAFFGQNKSRRLSRTLMETLAIIAYRQPVAKSEVDFIRGVDSDYAVRRLMELNLIGVVGRGEGVGRPLLYGTTDAFLEHFALNDLEDLPNLREIEELLDDPAFKRERAQLLLVQEQERVGDSPDHKESPVNTDSSVIMDSLNVDPPTEGDTLPSMDLDQNA